MPLVLGLLNLPDPLNSFLFHSLFFKFYTYARKGSGKSSRPSPRNRQNSNNKEGKLNVLVYYGGARSYFWHGVIPTSNFILTLAICCCGIFADYKHYVSFLNIVSCSVESCGQSHNNSQCGRQQSNSYTCRTVTLIFLPI